MTIHGEDDPLAEAQRVLDEHVTSSADGRCCACEVPGPCVPQETAAAVFTRLSVLPRQTPGLTRPELPDAHRVESPGVLATVG